MQLKKKYVGGWDNCSMGKNTYLRKHKGLSSYSKHPCKSLVWLQASTCNPNPNIGGWRHIKSSLAYDTKMSNLFSELFCLKELRRKVALVLWWPVLTSTQRPLLWSKYIHNRYTFIQHTYTQHTLYYIHTHTHNKNLMFPRITLNETESYERTIKDKYLGPMKKENLKLRSHWF